MVTTILEKCIEYARTVFTLGRCIFDVSFVSA